MRYLVKSKCSKVARSVPSHAFPALRFLTKLVKQSWKRRYLTLGASELLLADLVLVFLSGQPLLLLKGLLLAVLRRLLPVLDALDLLGVVEIRLLPLHLGRSLSVLAA